MYPIDCYSATNQDKLEAIKYYIDLNKAYLKETSVEECEVFTEYMKGEGKDILIKISSVQTDKELYSLLAKIDAKLPYGKNLKSKAFEQKLQILYRQFAKLSDEKDSYTSKEALKKQRELALLHDQTNDVCNQYRDAVGNQRYIKGVTSNPENLKKLFESKPQTKDEFKQNLENLIEQTNLKTKEARKQAFKMLREYNVKDTIYQMEQEKAEAQK